MLVVALFASVGGWIGCAYHHRIGPYAETQFAPRDPDARRAARGDRQTGGYWL